MHKSLGRHPLVAEIIRKLRVDDTAAEEFRKQLLRLGRFLTYELVQGLETINLEINAVFGKAHSLALEAEIVVLTVLRAALPLAQGIIEELPNASLALIAASRESKIDNFGREFSIEISYSKLPSCTNKTLIIVDPMLASGSTMVKILKLPEIQKAKNIIITSAISSKIGIALIEKEFPQVSIITGEIDDELNADGYIVPGLGDAGDRAFNTNFN